jgi:hypothetical protein
MCVRLYAKDLKLLHHFGSTMNSIYLHSQPSFEMTQKTDILECWNQTLQIICNLLISLFDMKSLKIPKGQSESVYRRKDNTISKKVRKKLVVLLCYKIYWYVCITQFVVCVDFKYISGLLVMMSITFSA